MNNLNLHEIADIIRQERELEFTNLRAKRAKPDLIENFDINLDINPDVDALKQATSESRCEAYGLKKCISQPIKLTNKNNFNDVLTDEVYE